MHLFPTCDAAQGINSNSMEFQGITIKGITTSKPATSQQMILTEKKNFNKKLNEKCNNWLLQ